MRINKKLTFNEWLFVLKAKKIVEQNMNPVLKFNKAKEEIEKNPKFQFLLEIEHQN